MHKHLLVMLTILALGITSGCQTDKDITSSKEDTQVTTVESVMTLQEGETVIQLGDELLVDGAGVTVDKKTLTITTGGTYRLTGDVVDGQIIVNTSSEENVTLILDNVSMTSSKTAPIYVMNAKNTYLVLEDGSENKIVDTSEKVDSTLTDVANAAIYSQDDLFIEGTGTLTIESVNHGVNSKDDLKINGGNIKITAGGDGLKGKDSITVTDGNILVIASGDGLQSSQDSDVEKGNINIEGGSLNITASGDGIQAENTVTISDGELVIQTGGGSTSTVSDISSKGIKALTLLQIDGGTMSINSADDSLHSNNQITINNGQIEVSSGDDGIHADTSIEINDGEITILKSYEGIESQSITINDGDIFVTATDDGINAGGGNDSSSLGRPGQNTFNTSSSCVIYINGGNVVIDAAGDGIDSNGSIYMEDGLVIVNGPTNSGNGALDYDGTFEQNGGTLLASGSAGMVQVPTSTTQNVVSLTFTAQEANTIVNIKSDSGDNILTFAPSKAFQSLIVSSDQLKTGESYIVSVGGSDTGNEEAGLYTNGIYNGGSEVISFTIQSNMTQASQTGASSGNMMGGNRNGNMGGMKPQRVN